LGDIESEIKRLKSESESIYTCAKQAMAEKADKIDIEYLNTLVQRKPDLDNLNSFVEKLKHSRDIQE